jgi:hypothetical protein
MTSQTQSMIRKKTITIWSTYFAGFPLRCVGNAIRSLVAAGDDPLGFLRPTSHRLTSLEVEETGIERNQHISHVAVDNDENFY